MLANPGKTAGLTSCCLGFCSLASLEACCLQTNPIGCVCVWCLVQAYYGISFALGGLGGSLVTSFSVAALAELPSYLLTAWAIERIGRYYRNSLRPCLVSIASCRRP